MDSEDCGEPEIGIPDHEVVRRIGRGSYGEVWLARSVTGVHRAVKVVRRSTFASDKPFARELAGLLAVEPISRAHEGVVDILHVGKSADGDAFYYVMELADDVETGQEIDPERYRPRTLAEITEGEGRTTLPVEACTEIGTLLTAALSHLHRNDLIHRDIKPSNVVFVGGRAKLADVGLVVNLSDARSFVGTSGYIPPEGPGTVQADIYSLGKVLYELSTGKDRCEFPVLPTLLEEGEGNGRRLVELNEIVLKACRNDPRERYQTAAQMQSELLLLGNGESVRRLRVLERRFKAIRRWAVAAAAAALVLCALAYPVYREWTIKEDEKQRQIGSFTAQAAEAIKDGDMIKALWWTAQARTLDPEDAILGRRQSGLLDRAPRLEWIWDSGLKLKDIVFSPDGESFAVLEFSGEKDQAGQIRLYETRSGRLLKKLGPHPWAMKVAFNPVGDRLVTSGLDKAVVVWDVRTGSVLQTWNHPEYVYAAVFSPDGRQVAVACDDRKIWLWDVESGKNLGKFEGHEGTIAHVAFSPDGTKLASAGREDHSARVWDVASFSEDMRLPHDTWLAWVEFSRDGSKLITSTQGDGRPCEATVWRLDRREVVRQTLLHQDGISSVGYSPDGQTIITASIDGTVGFWDAATHQPLGFNGSIEHKGRVLRADVSSDGRLIATVTAEGTARIWDLSASAPGTSGFSGALSDNGKWFVREDQASLSVFSTVDPARPAYRIAKPERGTREIACGNTGAWLLASSDVNRWTVYGPDDCQIPVPGVCTNITSSLVRFDPFDHHVAFRESTNVNVINLGDRSESVLAHSSDIATLAFSPVEGVLATADQTSVRVWDTTGKTPAQSWITNTDSVVETLAFSPEGNLLATGYRTRTFESTEVCVWDVETGRLLRQPFYPEDGVLELAFSHDGRKLVAGCENRMAMIWSLYEDSEPQILSEPGQVGLTRFGAGDAELLTAVRDMARLVEVGTDTPIIPRLQLPDRVRRGASTFNRLFLETTNSFKRGWYQQVWMIPVDAAHTSLENISELAGLYSWDRRFRTNAVKRLNALRSEVPEWFETSDDELILWHEQQLARCLNAENTPGVEFHLEQLAEFVEGRPALVERLGGYRSKLESIKTEAERE